MTITAPASTTAHAVAPPIPTRNHARAAGIFYLLTFASSIPALILIGPVLNDAELRHQRRTGHAGAVGLPPRRRERPHRGRLAPSPSTRS